MDQLSNLIITKSYPVVKIAKPNYGVVVFDRSVLLESESMAYGLVISIPLIIVGKSGGKMSCNKTYSRVRILETNSTSALVASHSRKASLHTPISDGYKKGA